MAEPILRRSPLTGVVCEVRFEGEPALTHSRLVALGHALYDLGLTNQSIDEGLQLTVGPGPVQQMSVSRHRFGSKDGSSNLLIDANVFAFQVAVYKGIDRFLDAWADIAKAVIDITGIESRTRIGLRYINELSLSGDSRETVADSVVDVLLYPWGEHELLQELSTALQELRFAMDEGELAFRHGLQRPPTGGAPSYVLDFDRYEQRLRALEIDDEKERLREFNKQVKAVFRWAVSEQQYEAFEPEEPHSD